MASGAAALDPPVWKVHNKFSNTASKEKNKYQSLVNLIGNFIYVILKL